MGGGNGQKSATARARRQKELEAKAKGSQLKANAAALSVKCSICLQTFICTTTESKLKEHSDNKHSTKTFAECFPDFGK